jgi:hypothetical protein
MQAAFPSFRNLSNFAILKEKVSQILEGHGKML